jgi:hypothetical protein
MDQDICSLNHFAPLTNLKENATGEAGLKCVNEGLTSSTSMENDTNQPITGNKIPIIINGRVTYGHINNIMKTLVN